MEARYLTDLEWRICHAVNIYIYRNGQDGEAPYLVHIPPAKKKNMKAVMNVINDRVTFPAGFAACLYKMDGKRVRHPCELEMYNNYVVASNYDKHFKCAQYGRKRSPLLVLNRDSKHIRVLKQQNQSYLEWSLKKKAAGEERPQYIYPTIFTNENVRAHELPVEKLGNLIPEGAAIPDECTPGEWTPRGQKAAHFSGAHKPSQSHGNKGHHQQPQQRPPTKAYQPNPYGVNTCTIQLNRTAQDAMRETQNYAGGEKRDSGHIDKLDKWESRNNGFKRFRNRKFYARSSDLMNANVLNNNNIESKEALLQDGYASVVSSRGSTASGAATSDSVMETDCLGSKYQDMLRQFKKKLKRQALLDVQSSTSSLVICRPSCRSQYRTKHRHPFHPLTNRVPRVVSTDEDNEQEDSSNGETIVVPPPPIAFRDGVIARRGEVYSYYSPQY